jgi:hypothetical protein
MELYEVQLGSPCLGVCLLQVQTPMLFFATSSFFSLPVWTDIAIVATIKPTLFSFLIGLELLGL